MMEYILYMGERERGREGTPLSFLEKFEHRLLLSSNNYHCFVAT